MKGKMEMLKKISLWWKKLWKAEFADNGEEYLGDFMITYYWNTYQDDFDDERDLPLYFTTLTGRTKAIYVSSQFARSLRMEGMGYVDDICLAFYDGKFRQVQFPTDAMGKKLVEDYSIAIPREFKLGTYYKIGNKNHVMYGCDRGSAITGNHIDIFIGKKKNQNYYESVYGKSGTKQKLFSVRV